MELADIPIFHYSPNDFRPVYLAIGRDRSRCPFVAEYCPSTIGSLHVVTGTRQLLMNNIQSVERAIQELERMMPGSLYYPLEMEQEAQL